MGFDAGWVDQVRSSKHLLNGGTCIDARIGNTYSMSHARPFGERMVCASGFFARSIAVHGEESANSDPFPHTERPSNKHFQALFLYELYEFVEHDIFRRT